MPRPDLAVWRWPASLQGRLLGGVLAVVVLVWLGAAASIWSDVRHELDELLDSHLAQAAALLVVQQARDLEDDEPTQDAPTLHKYAPEVAFQVFHESRLVLRSSNAPLTPMVSDGKPFKQGYKTTQIGGVAWRVFAAHGAERDVQVYVGEQVGSRAEILLAVMRGTLWPMAVALPLLALAAWWAIRQGLRPLRRLDGQLATRQPQSLQAVVLESAPTELSPIVDALNSLFERIGVLFEAERRFTADAAHELRTPIAAVRAQAQVAMAEPDPALRQHALQATLAGCDRATRLVEQLLTLSRLEAGEQLATGPVDLAAVARQVAADLATQALARQQVLELDADQPGGVLGNATLLAVLVRNLLDNAVRYSPVGASIQVSVSAHGPTVQMTVQDSGPGLVPADLARLGQRFFRVTGSSEIGSGLGWSIVQRIATVHGMELRLARSAKLGGLAVTLTAPLARASG